MVQSWASTCTRLTCFDCILTPRVQDFKIRTKYGRYKVPSFGEPRPGFSFLWSPNIFKGPFQFLSHSSTSPEIYRNPWGWNSPKWLGNPSYSSLPYWFFMPSSKYSSTSLIFLNRQVGQNFPICHAWKHKSTHKFITEATGKQVLINRSTRIRETTTLVCCLLVFKTQP